MNKIDNMFNLGSEKLKSPDTISFLRDKLFLLIEEIAGEHSYRYISIVDIKNIFKAKFGNKVNVDNIVDNYIKNNEENITLLEEIIKKETDSILSDKIINDRKKTKKLKKVKNDYDISSFGDLISWNENLTIYPIIENFLLKFKEQIDNTVLRSKKELGKFHKYTKKEKMEILISKATNFYISKNSWIFIENNLEKEIIIEKFIVILSIEADEVNINNICKAFINNIELFNHFILP